jgi:glutathione-regulated potassium-efflux system ancillary protein KefG
MSDSIPRFPRRVLVLFAHPSLDRSEVNVEMLRVTRATDGVTVVDLYDEYPDCRIDIDREQARLVSHDALVFMFPLYWYSTPPILKEWQDLVLEYGFAYGTDGTALHGKAFLCALSAGGAETAYRADGYNQFTLRELLRPLEQTAMLCGMHYLAPFALYGARTALEQGRIEQHLADWRLALEAVRDDRIDMERAAQAARLNEDLGALVRAGAR